MLGRLAPTSATLTLETTMKYSYITISAFNGAAYAYGICKTRHTYGPRTRLGVRTVWKELSRTSLGRFPTRGEATAAGKKWKAARQTPKPTPPRRCPPDMTQTMATP
jgi:hypothetical protein